MILFLFDNQTHGFKYPIHSKKTDNTYYQMFYFHKTRSLNDWSVPEWDSFVSLPWKGVKSMAKGPGFNLI